MLHTDPSCWDPGMLLRLFLCPVLQRENSQCTISAVVFIPKPRTLRRRRLRTIKDAISENPDLLDQSNKVLGSRR